MAGKHTGAIRKSCKISPASRAPRVQDPAPEAAGGESDPPGAQAGADATSDEDTFHTPTADDLEALAGAITLSNEISNGPEERWRVDHLAEDGGSQSEIRRMNKAPAVETDPSLSYTQILTSLAPAANKEPRVSIRVPNYRPPLANSKSQVPIPRESKELRKARLGPNPPSQPWFDMPIPKTMDEACSLIGAVFGYAGLAILEEGDRWKIVPEKHPDVEGSDFEQYLRGFAGPSLGHLVSWLKKSPANVAAAEMGCYPAHDFCGRRIRTISTGQLDPCCVCLMVSKEPVPVDVVKENVARPVAPAPPVQCFVPIPDVRSVPPPTLPSTLAPATDIPQPTGPYVEENPNTSMYELLKRGVQVKTKRGQMVKLPVPKSRTAIKATISIRGVNWKQMVKRYIALLPASYLGHDYDFDQIVYGA